MGKVEVRGEVASPEQLELVPVHRNDPKSSHEARERIAPRVGTQLHDVLGAIVLFGEEGASNREIQIAVCGGYNRGHPLFNKTPTRCRTLERMGLIELVTNTDGEPVLREHYTGGRFLVWRAK